MEVILQEMKKQRVSFVQNEAGSGSESRDDHLNAQRQRREGGARPRGGGAWERPVVIGSAMLLWVCLDSDVTVDDADERGRSLGRHTVRERERENWWTAETWQTE